ncbi:MAG: hypothetical protein WCX73_01610 [Candidatus Pacearchaeota archaeon]|jgi:hypothetical protein
MASLNQLSPEKRILFIKNFTSEILLSLIKEINTKQNIEKEKIKQKILSPIQEQRYSFHPELFSPSKLMKQSTQKEDTSMEIESYQKINIAERPAVKRVIDIGELRKPIFHRARNPILTTTEIEKQRIPLSQQSFSRTKTSSQPSFQPSEFQPSRQITQESFSPKQPSQKISPQIKALREIKPEAKPRPEGFALGKIDSLLNSKEIQSIECPGPEKNLLVKKYDKINITKIILSQEEITDILYSFAKQASIPVVGGILKAAVGDLVISAVISEFVGSRFIINKLTPYSLLENQ